MSTNTDQFSLRKLRTDLMEWIDQNELNILQAEEQSLNLSNQDVILSRGGSHFYSLVMMETFCTHIMCFVLKIKNSQVESLEKEERGLNMFFMHQFLHSADQEQFVNSHYKDLFKFESFYIFALLKNDVRLCSLKNEIENIVHNLDSVYAPEKALEVFARQRVSRSTKLFIYTPNLVISNFSLSEEAQSNLPVNKMQLRISRKERLVVNPKSKESEKGGVNESYRQGVWENTAEELRKVIKLRDKLNPSDKEFLHSPMVLINTNFAEVIKKIPGVSLFLNNNEGITTLTLGLKGVDKRLHCLSFLAPNDVFDQGKYLIPAALLQIHHYCNPKITALILSFLDRFDTVVYVCCRKIEKMAEIHEAMLVKEGRLRTLQQVFETSDQESIISMRANGELYNSKSFDEAMRSQSWREMSISLLHVFHVMRSMTEFAQHETRRPNNGELDFPKISPYASLSFLFEIWNKEETEMFEDIKDVGITTSRYNHQLHNSDQNFNNVHPPLKERPDHYTRLLSVDRNYFDFKRADGTYLAAGYQTWNQTWLRVDSKTHSDDSEKLLRLELLPQDREKERMQVGKWMEEETVKSQRIEKIRKGVILSLRWKDDEYKLVYPSGRTE